MLEFGQVVVSRESKSSGNVDRTAEGMVGSVGVEVASVKAATRSVRMGRTVSLGDFNFARVDCGVEFAADATLGDAIETARKVVEEILEREIAAITGSGRKKGDLSVMDGLKGRRIHVTYGMTKSLKAYESARFDVTVDEPVADGVDFEAALLAVQGLTSKFIDGELKRLKSAKPVGF
jgi:hypothetical protein